MSSICDSGSDPEHDPSLIFPMDFDIVSTQHARGKVSTSASLMRDLPQRRFLKFGSLSWTLVACGLVLKDLDAAAPSKSERDWLWKESQEQRPPESEIAG